jgi:TRAP-type C4-dicarboxylate transport system permease small subunit
MMRLLRRAAVTVGLVEIGGSVALLAAMVGLICYQVTARYLFRAPLAWVEELATYCFIWMTLLGAGLATKLGRQIRIQTLDHVMSPRAQVVLHAATSVLTGVVFIVVGWLASRIVPVELRTTSVSLPIDIPKAWFFTIPLCWACASIVLSAAYHLAAAGARLRGESVPPLFDIRDEGDADAAGVGVGRT